MKKWLLLALWCVAWGVVIAALALTVPEENAPIALAVVAGGVAVALALVAVLAAIAYHQGVHDDTMMRRARGAAWRAAERRKDQR